MGVRSRVVVRWIPSHPARPRAPVAAAKPGSRFRLLPRPRLSMPSSPGAQRSCLAATSLVPRLVFHTFYTTQPIFLLLLCSYTTVFVSLASWPSHSQPPSCLLLGRNSSQLSATPPSNSPHASTSHLRLRLSTASLSSQSTHRIEITCFDLALFNIFQTPSSTSS